ncbi:DUF932 domain-containing protein [Cupriavidus taiwanensis]|uniref:DUF932 domain-containing protein n=1 Tax=Cupriavidus taiwanensis TaxID=164546 RepID=UPI000E190C12|nr:DUF932 domain-containing protein [Cupriavidus taiwanensis]SPA17209.1 conserved hypothetical protein [Cupriavidus taiwanensis]
MAHEIDLSAARPSIAYAGEVPWHGLGQRLSPDAPLDVWLREAGLQWEVWRAAATFKDMGSVTHDVGRDVLYRSDTKSPLGIVSREGYHPVQPREVIQFFADLVGTAGFSMEVAGALRAGKRIWALARVGPDCFVRRDDAIAPFLLLSTSYDGSAATTAQLTTIRVVCSNTLSAASMEHLNRVSTYHSKAFNAEQVKWQLGLVRHTFALMMKRIEALAERQVSVAEVDALLRGVVPQRTNTSERDPVDEVRASRAYQSILGLFDGDQMGAEMASVKGTAWGLVSAVTQFVDHSYGRTADTRMSGAWFGDGNLMKVRAFQLAGELL